MSASAITNTIKGRANGLGHITNAVSALELTERIQSQTDDHFSLEMGCLRERLQGQRASTVSDLGLTMLVMLLSHVPRASTLMNIIIQTEEMSPTAVIIIQSTNPNLSY